MSQENVERLRVVFEDFLAGEREFGAGLLDPGIEWDSTELPIPDISGVYRGIDSVREFWRQWLAAWEAVRFSYEMVDAGDSVVVLIDQRMRGRFTGIDVPFGRYAHVYTFRDGLVVHWKAFMSQSQALQAVGLPGYAISQDSLEIARRWVGAYNRRDVDLLVGMTDADVVLDNSNAAFDGAVYRGHDGVREWFSWVQGMWKRQHIDPQEFIPVGEDEVIVHVRLISVGRDDVETVARGAAVMTVREEKIAQLKTFQSKVAALEAVGLSEQDAHSR